MPEDQKPQAPDTDLKNMQTFAAKLKEGLVIGTEDPTSIPLVKEHPLWIIIAYLSTILQKMATEDGGGQKKVLQALTDLAANIEDMGIEKDSETTEKDKKKKHGQNGFSNQGLALITGLLLGLLFSATAWYFLAAPTSNKTLSQPEQEAALLLSEQGLLIPMTTCAPPYFQKYQNGVCAPAIIPDKNGNVDIPSWKYID